MVHIAAVLTFIKYNSQSFPRRVASSVKCQIPSLDVEARREGGRKEGGISREMTPFRGATSHVSTRWRLRAELGKIAIFDLDLARSLMVI